MNARLMLGGLKSYLPLPASAYTGTGGSTTARYCYSVWLRHLTVAHEHGLPTRPATLVELGPGDSIGLGLAALLSGTTEYYALDVLKHANRERNLAVLDGLVELYGQRAAIPDDGEFPLTLPKLPGYAFPAHVLTPERLARALAPERVAELRASIDGRPEGPIRFICPWSAGALPPASADMVVTQAVLQDMDHYTGRDALTESLHAMTAWLRRGGVMSHVVDFSCPGGAPWNHHWAFGDLAWKVVRGRRPYYHNRVPLSQYLALIERFGCRVVAVLRRTESASVERAAANARFRALPDDDFFTSAATIVAVKE